MKGHREKHGNGYRYRYFAGYKPDGKKIYRVTPTYPTAREADAEWAKIKVQLDQGTYVRAGKETVSEYEERWLKTKEPQIEEGTFRQYSWLLKNHIIPRLGHIQLSKLRADHIQAMYAELENENVISQQSIGHLHRVLSQTLKNAVQWGLIAKNPAELAKPPKVGRHEFHVWTEAELEAFLAVAKERTRYYMLFLLGAATGMRLGEILGLKWSDVDLETGVIQVRRSGSKKKSTSTKTASSRRLIVMPSYLVEELRHHYQQQQTEIEIQGTRWKKNNLVVPTSVGTQVLQGNVRRLMERLIERAGVSRCRFHDLRHLHATLLLLKGVHAKIVQERLGHSSIQVTLDRYSHVVPGLQEQAATEIDAILRGSKNTPKD
ncbi:site-specific integrase [Alicyclobacillus hesperidum subsp. aegles]|uniref:tyrosine-type recombinase/integrase n=1 Tax=Alicyclobacillus TaxID=29330 RepID=UPI0011956ADA|nr:MULTISPECIES: site-specific integrase [Alicyclobacillus]GEO27497.1 site-specific integrase [Alicyclobacillus acidoterrestris]GLG02557.1 site-specific integrase [Alicyclobacillus hesperidum subsp. aegles]